MDDGQRLPAPSFNDPSDLRAMNPVILPLPLSIQVPGRELLIRSVGHVSAPESSGFSQNRTSGSDAMRLRKQNEDGKQLPGKSCL